MPSLCKMLPEALGLLVKKSFANLEGWILNFFFNLGEEFSAQNPDWGGNRFGVGRIWAFFTGAWRLWPFASGVEG